MTPDPGPLRTGCIAALVMTAILVAFVVGAWWVIG